MDSFHGWTFCFDCTVGHTGTGSTSVLRTLLDMRASAFSLRDEAASLMDEGRTPWMYSGECQHIYQGMQDFWVYPFLPSYAQGAALSVRAIRLWVARRSFASLRLTIERLKILSEAKDLQRNSR